MNPESQSERLSQATGHAHLGYPMQAKGPLGLVKRLLGRLLWPQFREQIDFNLALVEVLARLNEYSTHALQAIDNFENAFDNVDNAFDNVDSAFVELDRRERLLNERLDLVIRQSFVRYQEGVGLLQQELAETSQDLQRLVSNQSVMASDLREELVENVRTIESDFGRLRQQVSQVDMFLNEVKRAFPEPPAPRRLAALPGAIANLYPAFEDALRGPETEIRQRARSYLGDVVEIPVEGRVLDLGCGRGEWLDVLKSAGVDSYGVDNNEYFVHHCVAQGLEVEEADFRDHLKGLPEGELRAITAIHLVEHLDAEAVIEMLDLSLRALHPGGMLIVETPNPDNLFVGACTFYLDPTHVHPVPSALLEFLVNARGFMDVTVRKLKRSDPLDPHLVSDAPWSPDVARLWEFIQQRVAGPEDYAVLARRA